MNRTRTIGTTAIDSAVVYERIKRAEVNEVITYEELNLLTGRDVVAHRHILVTARNRALQDDQMIFDCITGHGIKRLSDSAIVEIESERPLVKIRSAMISGVKKLSCAKDISNDERIKVNASLAMFGAIAEFSKPKILEKVVSKGPKAVSMEKMLQMFTT